MKIRKLLSLCAVFLLSLVVAINCTGVPEKSAPPSTPVVMGYSNWPGWWPWAIAEQEGLFESNGAKVELKWFDSYEESMEAFAAGQIDANCQTLNDTIAFAPNSVNGQVVVLINDNSAGNDKIIVSEQINSIRDLKGKTIALEEGVVDDFLLTIALKENGMSRKDVNIKDLDTEAAVAAFAAGEVDGVGAFPPYWLTALKRQGSKELFSSKDFPGVIPDLLVVSQKLIDKQSDQVQALVNTWFATLDFMKKNPDKSEEIIAKRVNVSVEDLKLFKGGTKIFSIKDNLKGFRAGNNFKHLPFAAEKITEFLLEVDLIKQAPDLDKLFDDRFVKNYKSRIQS
ncbi:MAG: ABC transporter substrate-binding protein [Xenococcaceae cyanobacterium]